jgi:L-threonylcarbamoyladenylate synthase
MPLIFKLDPQSPDDSIIKKTAELVSTGKLVIYPTETFYGIGAIYSNSNAIKRIFHIKGRDKTKPILLLIRNINFLYKLSNNVPKKSLPVAKEFWPGPLTLLFKASPQISPLLTGETSKVGCRISDNLVTQRLLYFLKDPITSTSANLSGGPSPRQIDQIPLSLRESVDIILDAGSTPGGLPSTIMDVSEYPFTIIRKGAIPPEKIYEITDQ